MRYSSTPHHLLQSLFSAMRIAELAAACSDTCDAAALSHVCEAAVWVPAIGFKKRVSGFKTSTASDKKGSTTRVWLCKLCTRQEQHVEAMPTTWLLSTIVL